MGKGCMREGLAELFFIWWWQRQLREIKRQGQEQEQRQRSPITSNTHLRGPFQWHCDRVEGQVWLDTACGGNRSREGLQARRGTFCKCRRSRRPRVIRRGSYS